MSTLLHTIAPERAEIESDPCSWYEWAERRRRKNREDAQPAFISILGRKLHAYALDYVGDVWQVLWYPVDANGDEVRDEVGNVLKQNISCRILPAEFFHTAAQGNVKTFGALLDQLAQNAARQKARGIIHRITNLLKKELTDELVDSFWSDTEYQIPTLAACFAGRTDDIVWRLAGEYEDGPIEFYKMLHSLPRTLDHEHTGKMRELCLEGAKRIAVESIK
jgi:hypothetical protein